ncbi:MAG: TolC family protein [Planctomycetaceae bacterium]|nr:TolC family protein [Planctomycetaceae bacterium]
MRHRRFAVLTALALIAASLSGCFKAKRPLHYLGDKDLAYYKEVATQIDMPVSNQPPDLKAAGAAAPRTLRELKRDEVWDLTIAEALHIALKNNTVIRSESGGSATSILNNPNNAPSIYDPSIQETGVLFGGRGVEAALSDFDAQLSTSMVWSRDETVQNSPFSLGQPGSTLKVEGTNGQYVGVPSGFNSGVQKRLATGGTVALRHDWQYTGVNSSAPLFMSAYTGQTGVNFRQPLWAGSGVEFTRIAGPVSEGFTGITGVSQGVVIARINNDLTVADFEASVRNMMLDVEKAYWDLYFNYRVYDTSITARNSALRSWREAKAKLDIGGARNFKPADEAQARDRYFETRSQAEMSLSQIYESELRLRRLMGLPVNDCRVIRPSDEPTTAEFEPDWCLSLAESLTRRVELRKQKWNIRSLELQLRAANSLTSPSLAFVSEYHVNAFGDKLLQYDDDDEQNTQQGLNSAYETLTQGDQTGWTMGFEFSMPIGFRSARTQVRNYELRLAKAREMLAAQELEISHQLASALQLLARTYVTAGTNFNRRQAALRRVDLFEAELQAGTATLDLVLRAQASLATAENAYYSSLTEYNKAIVEYYYAAGKLLEYNNVHLAEGAWEPKAYEQALERAFARSHAIDNKLLKTEPEEFVLPAFDHHVVMPGPHVEQMQDGVIPGDMPQLDVPLPSVPLDAPAIDAPPKDASPAPAPAPPPVIRPNKETPASPDKRIDPFPAPSTTDEKPAADSPELKPEPSAQLQLGTSARATASRFTLRDTVVPSQPFNTSAARMEQGDIALQEASRFPVGNRPLSRGSQATAARNTVRPVVGRREGYRKASSASPLQQASFREADDSSINPNESLELD